MKLFIM